jgi:hypothetical protein
MDGGPVFAVWYIFLLFIFTLLVPVWLFHINPGFPGMGLVQAAAICAALGLCVLLYCPRRRLRQRAVALVTVYVLTTTLTNIVGHWFR